MKRLLFVFVLISFSRLGYTQILGPMDYETCMNDGRVGRTHQELALKHRECTKRFPALPSIANKSNRSVVCTLGRDFDFEVSLHSDGKTAVVGANQASVASFTGEVVSLEYLRDGELVRMSIDYRNGTFEIYVRGRSGSDKGNCKELR